MADVKPYFFASPSKEVSLECAMIIRKFYRVALAAIFLRIKSSTSLPFSTSKTNYLKLLATKAFVIQVAVLDEVRKFARLIRLRRQDQELFAKFDAIPIHMQSLIMTK